MTSDRKTIIVASHNPVKLNATIRGFERMFPGENFKIEGADIASMVSNQPLSDEETYRGALNRAQSAARIFPAADYWVGIEGGLEVADHNPTIMTAFAWVVIQTPDRLGQSRTATFVLPPAVSDLIRLGKELGEADDLVFQRTNSKQANGAIGILTDDVIDRTQYYEQAVILALIPIKNQRLY